ncbi:MAG: thermonuclease family protein [Kiloniellaceae bacterium]
MCKPPKPFIAAVLPGLLGILLLLGIVCDAAAQLGSGSIGGRAPQVIDSGLIDFAGQPVYLYGLRGARPDQVCSLSQQTRQTWACGQEARWAAANRIANHWVDCVERARGAGGEIFAVCYLGGVGGPELNAWLVEQGWAKAAHDYAEDYAEAEDSARAARRGLWRGQ